MLIVNADDWGYDTETTNAIGMAFEAGSLTSVTAMVHMTDSERAARLAIESGVPVGLHLNLMEPFTASHIDPQVRRQQRDVVRRFRTGNRQRWLSPPQQRRLVRSSVEEQLDEFSRIYGRRPGHVDGHQHGHLSFTVLRTLARRGVTAVRPSFTFRRDEKSLGNRSLRAALNGIIRRRFVTSAKFYSVRDLHQAFGGKGILDAISEARGADVEIMVHPGLADELALLVSAEWSSLLGEAPLGTYEALVQSHVE